jgi:hypothetical protein
MFVLDFPKALPIGIELNVFLVLNGHHMRLIVISTTKSHAASASSPGEKASGLGIVGEI